jgi:hypothetical protein
MPKLWASDTFAAECRRLYVLAGSTADGQIRAGTIVNVPLNSSPLQNEPLDVVA